MKDIRILLADDHEIVRYGVRGILEQEEDMEIVADCASTDEALFLTEVVSPNIILMDTDVPGIGGIEATRRLLQKQKNCKVILLTLDKECLDEAIAAGAAGYLLEDINHLELVQAIRKAYRGELVIDERITSASQAATAEPEHPSLKESIAGEVELVISPPFEAVQLLRFLCQVEEALEATIMQEIGSWHRGTTLTIVPRKSSVMPDILNRLANMPEVGDVIEKPIKNQRFSGLPLKIMPDSATTLRKVFQITLKQTNAA